MASAKRQLRGPVEAAEASPNMHFHIADQSSPENLRGKIICQGAAIGSDGESYPETFPINDALSASDAAEFARLYGLLRAHVAR